MPRGSLLSKPTWSKAFGCSATSAFLFRYYTIAATTKGELWTISKGGLIVYIGCGLVTSVIVVVLVVFVLRR
jgi:sensor c-di-GMP phosphodiesterase-like protein